MIPGFLALLAALADQPGPAEGFNLDTRAPVVKVGSGDQTFFGFSVAQHQVGKDRGPVLLVGAPQDNNLQPGTSRSGALYQCPLSSYTEDCQQVVTDGLRRADGRYDGRVGDRLLPPLHTEIKEDQWLGGAVTSQGVGGKVAVCAHRYSVRNPEDSKRAMLGMCYILDPDLSLPNKDLGATHVMAVREALHGKGLSPKGDFDNHDKHGVCQVGTSVAWADKEGGRNSSNSDYALFGAPGCFTWRGNLYGRQPGSIRESQAGLGESNFLSWEKHGHLGASITSGAFYDGEVQFAAGAPNVLVGSGTGEVQFYQRHHRDRLLAQKPERTLSSESFGAGFGSALATIDANGDGRDDLLVSAPFSDRDERGGAVFLFINLRGALKTNAFLEIRGRVPEGQFGLAVSRAGDLNRDGYQDFAVGAPYEDGGAVYIFLGAAEGIAGAPRVGRQWLKAEHLASQVIRAEQLVGAGQHHLPLPRDLATFGGSIAGGMDMDGNGYPDLLVGAFSSSAVVLLKARPIINVTTSLEDSMLRRIDPGKAGCLKDPNSPHACFHFSACFTVEEDQVHQMKIQFEIVAEPKKPVSRVWLRLDGGSEAEARERTVGHILNIQESRKALCTTIIGYVSDTQTDLQSPVQFSLSYSLVQEDPLVFYNTGRPLPLANSRPILNQQQARRTFYAKFQKNCGNDEVCQAQLSIAPVLLDRTSRPLARTPQGAYQLELGTTETKELVLQVIVKNLGEAAYEAELGIAFPSSLSYVGLGQGSDINAPSLVNSSFLSIDLGNPFKGISKDAEEEIAKNKKKKKLHNKEEEEEKAANTAKLLLRFSPSNLINQTLIRFDFGVNTTSELVVDASTYLHCVIVKRAEVSITGRSSPEAVFYGGEVRGESAMREENELGPAVSHRYLVKNYGPSTVDVLTVALAWPHQVENGREQGKWLLYLTSLPLVRNGAGSCRLPPGHQPNPLSLTTKGEARHKARSKAEEKEEVGKRAKREVERVVPAEQVVEEGELRRVVRLDCNRGTAKCLAITCQVYGVRANTSFTVEVKSRLWNSTLVEDYANVDRVEIVSKASVIVDPVYTQEVRNDFEAIVTMALPERQLEPVAAPSWWIYVIAALCGLLLLLTIVLILAKLGFFKRKRPDEAEDVDFMVSANFEKVRLSDDL